jgi:hypothetical protein
MGVPILVYTIMSMTTTHALFLFSSPIKTSMRERKGYTESCSLSRLLSLPLSHPPSLSLSRFLPLSSSLSLSLSCVIFTASYQNSMIHLNPLQNPHYPSNAAAILERKYSSQILFTKMMYVYIVPCKSSHTSGVCFR